MAAIPLTTATAPCFVTTVRNITAVALHFGFLGRHGKLLQAGQTYTVKGDIRDQIAPVRRKFDAFERAVDGFTDANGVVIAPTLALLSTPSVHMADSTTHATKILKLTNGTLGTTDSCYGAYTSH